MKKKVPPIGIDDFKELIEKNYYFADKTLLIDDLLSQRNKATLISRPRRFGKTLSLSMLKYFFDIENRDENRKLFNSLKIENTNKMKHQGEYPVIFLTFKDVKTSTWELCLEKLIFELKKEYEKYGFKLDERRAALENSLFTLSKLLYERFGKKPIILIDEYDTPLITARMKNYYKEARSFFDVFLGCGLKGNDYLEFGVMTSVISIIIAHGIVGGLDNLYVSTILDSDYPHFGLTEDEVKELLQYYDLTHKLEDVKEWYNGYRFGEQQVYNPWSIMNFAKNNELKSYWVKTISDDAIEYFFKDNDCSVFDDLDKLFVDETISRYIEEHVCLDSVEGYYVWTLMFFTGYLTYKRVNISPITMFEKYELQIPNKDIFNFLKNFLRN